MFATEFPSTRMYQKYGSPIEYCEVWVASDETVDFTMTKLSVHINTRLHLNYYDIFALF